MKNAASIILLLAVLAGMMISRPVAQNKTSQTDSKQGKVSVIEQCLKDKLAGTGRTILSIELLTGNVANIRVRGRLDRDSATKIAKMACECGAGSSKTEAVDETGGGGPITIYITTCADIPLAAAIADEMKAVELSKKDSVQIKVSKGNVTLTGGVSLQKTKIDIEKAVRRAGAKKVSNLLKVVG